MRKKDDLLWKVILEDVFDDFLRFMNPDAESLLDLDKCFEFLDKELQQVFPPDNDEFSPKIVDKLVKVYTKSGVEKWILVHVEIQGQYHNDFASRMFRYYYRLFDNYAKPITAYAIFTEANSKPRPDNFEIDFMGTSLKYTFNTYKIADQSDEELITNNNPFALVVLTAKMALSADRIKNSLERDELLLDLKLNLAKRLLMRQIPKSKIRVLMNFLRYYTRFESPEINSKFEQAVEALTERSTTMGIEEFLLDRATEQGKKEGIIAIAREMKKEGISFEQIAKFTKLSIEEIEKL